MANELLYGFYNLRDMRNEPIAAVQPQVISDSIQRTLDEHTRQIDALVGMFAQRGTRSRLRYRSAGVSRNQPIDEIGRARPVRRAGYYDLGFPLHRSGQAWGIDYETRLKTSVQELSDLMDTILTGDARWMRDHLLAALLDNTTWTFDDEVEGDITIQPLANGDATVYLIQNAAEAGATDTHFFATASAIADAANPFPAIYTELMEHPENGGQVIALVPTNLKSAIQGLAGFTERADPNVRLGSAVNELVAVPTTPTPGVLFGYVDQVYVYEWNRLPNGYMIATTTEGNKPLMLREPEQAELRGFRQHGERQDFPWYEAQLRRYAGFGAYNRVGALVYRVGDAAYAIPSGYLNPIR